MVASIPKRLPASHFLRLIVRSRATRELEDVFPPAFTGYTRETVSRLLHLFVSNAQDTATEIEIAVWIAACPESSKKEIRDLLQRIPDLPHTRRIRHMAQCLIFV